MIGKICPQVTIYEAGKFADFIIIDKNIMEVPVVEVPNIKVVKTFVGGESVYN